MNEGTNIAGEHLYWGALFINHVQTRLKNLPLAYCTLYAMSVGLECRACCNCSRCRDHRHAVSGSRSSSHGVLGSGNAIRHCGRAHLKGTELAHSSQPTVAGGSGSGSVSGSSSAGISLHPSLVVTHRRLSSATVQPSEPAQPEQTSRSTCFVEETSPTVASFRGAFLS